METPGKILAGDAHKTLGKTLAGGAAPRWLAAELVQWQSLYEDLHATTQVLAELAGKLHVATQVPA